jgi:hypothetical protein
MTGMDDFSPGNKFIRRDAGLLLEKSGKMFARNIEFRSHLFAANSFVNAGNDYRPKKERENTDARN